MAILEEVDEIQCTLLTANHQTDHYLAVSEDFGQEVIEIFFRRQFQPQSASEIEREHRPYGTSGRLGIVLLDLLDGQFDLAEILQDRKGSKLAPCVLDKLTNVSGVLQEYRLQFQ